MVSGKILSVCCLFFFCFLLVSCSVEPVNPLIDCVPEIKETVITNTKIVEKNVTVYEPCDCEDDINKARSDIYLGLAHYESQGVHDNYLNDEYDICLNKTNSIDKYLTSLSFLRKINSTNYTEFIDGYEDYIKALEILRDACGGNPTTDTDIIYTRWYSRYRKHIRNWNNQTNSTHNLIT